MKKCWKCLNIAVWHYQAFPESEKPSAFYCDEHVPRGCSCNIIDGKEELDEQGRQLPCCEYFYDEKGWDY